jgi:hypothetical protein
MTHQIALLNNTNKVVDTLIVDTLDQNEINTFLSLEVYQEKGIVDWAEVPESFPISLDFEYTDGEFRHEYPTLPGEWTWNSEVLQWRKPFPTTDPEPGATWLWNKETNEWDQVVITVGR